MADNAETPFTSKRRKITFKHPNKLIDEELEMALYMSFSESKDALSDDNCLHQSETDSEMRQIHVLSMIRYSR
ncbi:hypothetical protein RN001_016423 [Aquatica leii]|uniref:Uncharacterized protein n=1 Tax=Aquatica leii TaxID=1421715 RepID=A0AAN7PN89_9COLE|nr:hypothetical protein RN001_016423 [Aquatica leii]